MIATALLGAVLSLALVEVWGRRPSRRRLRRAQRQLGRLAPPMRRALPGAELRDPCGHLLAFRCGCGDRRAADARGRRPPWYREVPMPRPLLDRKD